MSRYLKGAVALLAAWAALVALHGSFLRLPYYWDEAGYYVPAALDLWRHGLLIPKSTLTTGHTPLVSAYLALAWSAFGFSSLVTRVAMLLVAGATVVSAYALARAVLGDGPERQEAAAWSAVILTLTPLFFAQSSLVHLDLTVALFTLLAVWALLRERWTAFAALTSLAVLSKETAIILVPAVGLFVWYQARRERRRIRGMVWLALISPGFVLGAWTLYYHHRTGYWTGNAYYLKYNLYSTLSPVRVVLSFLRRLYEIAIGGFNWLIATAALAGAWWSRRKKSMEGGASRERMRSDGGEKQMTEESRQFERRFALLTVLLTAAYVLMLSVVGGAVLPRYLLPIFPPLVVLAMAFVWRLPKAMARGVCVTAAACLVSAWFINPPYPFPFEDNLAYADFVLLHQQAAQYLSERAAESETERDAKILTAWPASDELTRPKLGYVSRPLKVIPLDGFTPADFEGVAPGSFDVLCIYSRKWEPASNLLVRLPSLGSSQREYFDYAPQIGDAELAARFHLRRIARWERRGQWIAIYQADSHN